MFQNIICLFLQGICREQAGGFRPLYQFADYNWCGRHVQRLVICPKTKDLKRWNSYKFCIPFHKCIRSVTMLFENDVYSTVNSSVNTSCYPQNIISFWNTYCRIFSCILDAYSKYVCKNPPSCVVERKTSTKASLWISTSHQINFVQLMVFAQIYCMGHCNLGPFHEWCCSEQAQYNIAPSHVSSLI